MNENETIDQAAQDQEDHDSMVESTVDRKIILVDERHDVSCRCDKCQFKWTGQRVAKPGAMDQPKIADFTRIEHFPKMRGVGQFALYTVIDSTKSLVGRYHSREQVERAQLAIVQMTIGYHAKRNAWEKETANEKC